MKPRPLTDVQHCVVTLLVWRGAGLLADELRRCWQAGEQVQIDPRVTAIRGLKRMIAYGNAEAAGPKPGCL